MSRLLVTLAAAFLVVGCAASRGFDRGALKEALASAPATEEDIQRVLDLRPQLPRPFKLGIFFKDGALTRSDRSQHQWYGWNWQPRDKDTMVEVGTSLQRDAVVSHAFIVSPEISNGQDLKSIRLAAARQGADAVMVISGVADVDRYNNLLGPTYALLITALIVPGSVADALFVSHAGLWDVRNEFLYAAAEADGQASLTRPAALLRDEVVVAQARARSIAELATAMKRHIRNLSK